MSIDVERLAKKGLIANEGGRDGVRVSIQFEKSMSEPSRRERRAALNLCFSDLARDLAPLGVRIDLDKCSVSAQTVEAFVPVERYDEVVKMLAEQSIRTDLIERRQVV